MNKTREARIEELRQSVGKMAAVASPGVDPVTTTQSSQACALGDLLSGQVVLAKLMLECLEAPPIKES